MMTSVTPRLLLPAVLLVLSALSSGAIGQSVDYHSFTTRLNGAASVNNEKLDHLSFSAIVNLEGSLNDSVTFGTQVSAVTEAFRYRDDFTATDRHLHDQYLDLDRLVFGYSADDYDLQVGHQVITWGRSDAFTLLDRFNGRDLCEFSDLVIDHKTPNLLGRYQWSYDDVGLELVVAPYSAVSELAESGTSCEDRFNDPNRFDFLKDTENNSLSDWAAGFEYSVTKDSFEISLNAMSTREDVFLLRSVPVLTKFRPRTFWLGGSGSVNVFDDVLRIELAFAPERSYSLEKDAVETILRSGGLTDGTTEVWNGLALIGYDTEIGDWTVSGQLFFDYVEEVIGLSRGRSQQFASLRVRKTFLTGRVGLEVLGIYDPKFDDAALRTDVTYELNTNSFLKLGATFYEKYGGKRGFFGSFDEQSRVSMAYNRQW